MLVGPMDSPDTPSAHTGGRRLSAGHDGWMDDLLEAGFAVGHELTPVRATLEHTGRMYRGDAGDHGGHVFLLEASPGLRVACLHIVDHESRQWQDYLQLRDLLRHSADARDTYEAVKQRLREQVGDDRDAYTEGKSAIIGGLLSKT